MPSQSPINGSTKYRTSISAMTAGGSHHRHARQNAEAVGRLSDVFVVRGIWVNELSFDRSVRSLHHFYAISLRIVLNFVHDVVDKEHSSTGGTKQVGRITWIRNLVNVEALAFVFDRKTRFFLRQFRGDLHELCQIVFVSVLDRVYECFVERDEEIRAFRTNQTELGHAFLQKLEDAIHQREVAGKFKLDLFVNVRITTVGVAEAELVSECLFNYLAQLVAVVRQAQIVCGPHFESLDYAWTMLTARDYEMLAV